MRMLSECLRLKSWLVLQSSPTRTEVISPRRRTLQHQERFLTAWVVELNLELK
jgi:hypothetical protein